MYILHKRCLVLFIYGKDHVSEICLFGGGPAGELPLATDQQDTLPFDAALQDTPPGVDVEPMISPDHCPKTKRDKYQSFGKDRKEGEPDEKTEKKKNMKDAEGMENDSWDGKGSSTDKKSTKSSDTSTKREGDMGKGDDNKFTDSEADEASQLMSIKTLIESEHPRNL